MKRTLIITLACINVALLAALVLATVSHEAKAQVYRGGADYLMMTGQIGTDWDAVYVIDLGQRRMLGWRLEKAKKRLVAFRGRHLKNDFRRETAEN